MTRLDGKGEDDVSEKVASVEAEAEAAAILMGAAAAAGRDDSTAIVRSAVGGRRVYVGVPPSVSMPLPLLRGGMEEEKSYHTLGR